MDERFIVGGSAHNPKSIIVGMDDAPEPIEEIEEIEPVQMAIKEIEFSLGDASAIARDSCVRGGAHGSVVTCRTLGAALHRLGIDCLPVTTRTVVFNPYVAKEFKPERMPSKKRMSALLNHPKGYSVGLGMEEAEGDGWKGHLVLLANMRDGIYLLDPTLDQANRPKYKIELMPIALKLVDTFTLFDGARIAFNINGCAIMYSMLPSDKSFADLEDWSLQTPEFNVDSISNQIFERLISLGTQ